MGHVLPKLCSQTPLDTTQGAAPRSKHTPSPLEPGVEEDKLISPNNSLRLAFLKHDLRLGISFFFFLFLLNLEVS